MKREACFVKFKIIALAVLSAMLFSGCSFLVTPVTKKASTATTGTNPVYTTNVNIEASDLILGDAIDISANFDDQQFLSGFAMQLLTYKALEGTDYDFVFMPRYERQGSKLTLKGRPAKLKSATTD